MTKYICENCKYQFESGLSYSKRGCPYCGENHVIEEPSAQDILSEID